MSWLVVAAVVGIAFTPTTAAARSGEMRLFTPGFELMTGYSVNVGYFYETGPSDLRPAGADVMKGNPVSTGLTYYERQGLISGYLIAIAAAAAGSYGNSLPKKTTYTRKGSWVVERKYYLSPEARAKADKDVADRSARIGSASNQSFEFMVYMRSLPGTTGETSGYRLNMFFGIPIKNEYMLDLGFGWGKADAWWKVDGVDYRAEWIYVGMPFRFNIPLPIALAWIQWDWNWWGHGEPDYEYRDADKTRFFRQATPFPVRIGLTTAILDRIHAEFQVVTPSLMSFEFAYRITVGAKF